jgi:hypothetical protein
MAEMYGPNSVALPRSVVLLVFCAAFTIARNCNGETLVELRHIPEVVPAVDVRLK